MKRDDAAGAEPSAGLVDGLLDLVLGSHCVGCARPGVALCATCRADLPATARIAELRPRPPGLVPVYAAADHCDLAGSLVVGHKERAQWGLQRPLGQLLAIAVRAALADHAGPVLLCPVPPAPGSVRRRGHDPLGSVVRAAAVAVRRWHRESAVADLLRSWGTGADQGGLDAHSRAVNVAHTMAVAPDRLRRTRRRHPVAWVVLCDDVVTTGATLREAQRALQASGVSVLAAATVTTAVRRSPRTPVRPTFARLPFVAPAEPLTSCHGVRSGPEQHRIGVPGRAER